MNKKYEVWIREMFDKYKSVLFLEKYHFRVEFGKDADFLQSEFNYPYLDIKIIYSKKSVEHWKEDKSDAERRMIHEFCHTITDPMYNIVLDWPTKKQIERERERLTDHIAQIVNKHFNLIGKK